MGAFQISCISGRASFDQSLQYKIRPGIVNAGIEFAVGKSASAACAEEEIAFAEQEQVDDFIAPPMEELQLFHNHRSGYRNGVRYIIAGPNETFTSLAVYLNMYERTLRKYNDALDTRELREGDLVYIYPKKKKSSRKYPSCYFKTGDTAWDIAQRYGIKLKSLYDLNGIPYGTPLSTYQRLSLR